ncbi:hypothetical protein [Streptomyces sp. NPDC086835]
MTTIPVPDMDKNLDHACATVAARLLEYARVPGGLLVAANPHLSW